MSRRPVVITSILFATMWCAWAADVVVSGTVVDSSGAAIAGAAVQVQSANRTVLRTTESDMKGSFTISGLSAGNYRLVVSHADFETKEIPVTIGAEAPAPFGRLVRVLKASRRMPVGDTNEIHPNSRKCPYSTDTSSLSGTI
jgi:hypothetical protein